MNRRIFSVFLVMTAVLLGQPRALFATPISGTLDIVPLNCLSALTLGGSYFQLFDSTGTPVPGLTGEGCVPRFDTAAAFPISGRISAGRGLMLDSYQYDDVLNPSGDGYSGILAPFSFLGAPVDLNTSPTDYQTGLAVPAPHLEYNPLICANFYCRIDPALSNFSAWDVFSNGENFNQGSPKPDGTFPSMGSQATTALTGAYNLRTRQYRIYWQSTILGGPFDGYTGHWQLMGEVQPTHTPIPPPTWTNTPSCTPPPFIPFTNTTGQVASDFHVDNSPAIQIDVRLMTPNCSSLKLILDDPFVITKVDLVSPTACIYPGDSISLSFRGACGQGSFPGPYYWTLFGTPITSTITPTPTNTATDTPTHTPTATPISLCEQQWPVTLFTTAGNKGKLTATTIGNIVDPANVSGKGTRIALCPGTSVSVNIHDASGTPHVTPLTPGMTCDPISVGQEATCRVLSLVRTEKLLAESNDGTDKLRMSYLPKK